MRHQRRRLSHAIFADNEMILGHIVDAYTVSKLCTHLANLVARSRSMAAQEL